MWLRICMLLCICAAPQWGKTWHGQALIKCTAIRFVSLRLPSMKGILISHTVCISNLDLTGEVFFWILHLKGMVPIFKPCTERSVPSLSFLSLSFLFMSVHLPVCLCICLHYIGALKWSVCRNLHAEVNYSEYIVHNMPNSICVACAQCGLPSIHLPSINLVSIDYRPFADSCITGKCFS